MHMKVMLSFIVLVISTSSAIEASLLPTRPWPCEVSADEEVAVCLEKRPSFLERGQGFVHAKPGFLQNASNHRPAYPNEPNAWAAAIRQEIERLYSQKANRPEWMYLKNDVSVRPPRGADMALRRQLLDEIDFAQARIASDDLLARISRAPSFDEGGLGVMIGISREAKDAGLPEQLVSDVRQAARQRATDLLRPRLKSIAENNPDVEISLQGLFTIRAILAPVMAYEADMIREIGVLDAEGILQPLFQRIATVEQHEEVRRAFRVELLKALDDTDPETAIDDLFLRAFGPGPHQPHLQNIKVEADLAIAGLKMKEVWRTIYFPQVLRDIANGNIQTHQDLPERAPLAYAMRHEFLDKLVERCGEPSRTQYTSVEREIMDVWRRSGPPSTCETGKISTATQPSSIWSCCSEDQYSSSPRRT